MFRSGAILLVIGLAAIQTSLAWPETRGFETNFKDAFERREETDMENELLNRLRALESKRDLKTCYYKRVNCFSKDCFVRTDIGLGYVLYNNNKLTIQFDDRSEDRKVDFKERDVTLEKLPGFFPYKSEDFQIDGVTYFVTLESMTIEDNGNISIKDFCITKKE